MGEVFTKVATIDHQVMLTVLVMLTGPQNVTNMWKDHFEKLYNSSAGINLSYYF